MIQIETSKNFKKQFKKLRSSQQERFFKHIEIFQQNPCDPRLKNHVLKGKYQGMHSINIGGDLRAIYTEKGKFVAIYVAIGTHSQLYG